MKDIPIPNPEAFIPKRECPPKFVGKEIKIVFCFPQPKGKFAFVPNLTTLSAINMNEYKHPKVLPAVRIYNNKTDKWEDWAYVDYFDNCPVCDSPMRVFVLRGTTWLALCSPQCYEYFEKKVDELGGYEQAVRHLNNLIEMRR